MEVRPLSAVMGAEVRDFGNGFRADLGFVPQVGYREVVGGGGLRFFPETGFFRFVRPSIFLDRQTAVARGDSMRTRPRAGS